jgi:hypothetical protein
LIAEAYIKEPEIPSTPSKKDRKKELAKEEKKEQKRALSSSKYQSFNGDISG